MTKGVVDDSTWAIAGSPFLFFLCQMRANFSAKPKSGTGCRAGASMKAYWKDLWWKAQIPELYLNVLCFGWSLTNTYAASNYVNAGNGKKLSS